MSLENYSKTTSSPSNTLQIRLKGVMGYNGNQECLRPCPPHPLHGAACYGHGHLFALVRHDPVPRDARHVEKSPPPCTLLARCHAGPFPRADNLGRTSIGLTRDSLVSVMYAEGLNSAKSSSPRERTDRHEILGQKPSGFQGSLCQRQAGGAPHCPADGAVQEQRASSHAGHGARGVPPESW